MTPRRCSGYCGLRVKPGSTTTFIVIEPDGQFREFCDGDCLATHYAPRSRSVAAMSRLMDRATVVLEQLPAPDAGEAGAR